MVSTVPKSTATHRGIIMQSPINPRWTHGLNMTATPGSHPVSHPGAMQQVNSRFGSGAPGRRQSQWVPRWKNIWAQQSKRATVTWRALVQAILRKAQQEPGAEESSSWNTNGANTRKKSYVNPENIQSFNRDESNLRLEEQIKLQHLQQLMIRFQNHRPPKNVTSTTTSLYAPAKYMRRQPGLLDQEEFKKLLVQVLGTHKYDDQLDNLFTKLDTSCDGYVDWNEFCTYMLLQYRENDYMRTQKVIPFQQEPRIRHAVHNRQETTTKVVVVENPFKYVSISKEGAMCIWDLGLHLEQHYVISDGVEEGPRAQKRRFKTWITDAVYMPNCNKIAISSTGRDIHFYDVTSAKYFEEFHLFSLPDVPSCLHYWYNDKYTNSEAILFCGDDGGAISLFYFKQPVSQLFQTPFKHEGGVQKIYMQDLSQHSKWVRHVRLENVHPDFIRKVMYMPDNDCIISSSASHRSSIVIMDVQRKRKTYVFKLTKGVECFDYNKGLNVLVTGSSDYNIRVWNPYVTVKPVAIMVGHAVGVIDVQIHEGLAQVFSYSKDAVLKVWDLKEHTCLQTVTIKFPSSLHGRMPEHGPFPSYLHLRGSQHTLVVASSDYLALLKLGQTKQPVSLHPTTHLTQLCCALYNPFFKQVVTSADDSTIAVWDLETGAKSLVFTNAHGEEEITCMGFDASWRRLITGARNGTIKVWNIQNGHNLHKLEAVGEAEVTGVVPIPDRKIIISVGWSRKITIHDDSDPDNHYVKAENTWKGGQVHQDDILALAYCPNINMIATASFDGEICVWNLETEKLTLRLKKGHVTKISKQMKNLAVEVDDRPASTNSQSNSRPNSRHRKSHKPPKGQAAPVDKLLFLQARAAVKRSPAALLVSSEAGTLRWWSIYAPKRELGYFYAPSVGDESVLGMCTNPSNSVLVTGDTLGYITVWDIMDYCTMPRDRRVRTKPPMEHTWRAHESAVVSVEYISHDHGCFVVSASTDMTAQLWTQDGQYVGTFGQKQSWNLKNPSTWAQQKTMWSDERKENNTDKELANGLVGALELQQEYLELDIPTLERGETLMSEESSIISPSPGLQPSRMLDGEENETTTPPPDIKLHTPVTPARDNEADAVQENEIKTVISEYIKPKSVTIDTRKSYLHDGRSSPGLRLKHKSHTFAFGSRDSLGSKSVLGKTVEKNFARMKLDRQGRRGTFGEVTINQTSRLGRLCCPFQALAMPEISRIELPSNLPMTPRMTNRGYTSADLTEDTLNTMDLSYYPETPPNSNQSQRKSPPGKTPEEKTNKLPTIKNNRFRYSASSKASNKKSMSAS